MKSFSDVLEPKVATEDLPSIYCDMDEVPCNYERCKSCGGWFFVQQKADRWNKISNTKNFEANLEDAHKKIVFIHHKI